MRSFLGSRLGRLSIGVLLAGAVVLGAASGWKALGRASALTTSYSAVIAHRESIAVNAYELLSGALLFRRVAARVVATTASDRERLQALMEWAHENVRPQYAAPTRVVPDNFLDIVRRGHGYCDQTAHVFSALAHFAGYDVHLLFLHTADGTSPHTVAEARVDGRWVLVDPWIGTLFFDRDGRLAGVAELGTDAALPPSYELLRARTDVDDFRSGTRFETFPYQGVSGFVSRVWSKVRDSERGRATPVAPGPAPERVPPPASEKSPRPTLSVQTPEELRAEILQMDAARWAHLDGRYDEAIAGYRRLLEERVPSDMAESVRFFLGLALLRAGALARAVAAFDAALDAAPRTAWTPSVRYYRAEARLRMGDVTGAVTDLRAANIPPATRRLVSLAPDEDLKLRTP